MSKYAAAHVDPQGAGDARPTALQIIEDECLVGALEDKIIVITGSTSGIGLEAARALLHTGARLIATARNVEKAEAGALKELAGVGKIKLVEMDNASLESVRTAAANILTITGNQVNVLVNNAGVMGIPELRKTSDGFEEIFATNHLSHFLLFQLLKPALLASATSAWPSRVVNVASSTHRAATLTSGEDYHYEKSEYNDRAANARSKLAQLYTSNEIERRYGAKNLHATSVHPGAIATNISRHLDQELLAQILANPYVAKYQKSPEQGAATTVLAAVGKEWANRGGVYLEDCQLAGRGKDDGDEFGVGFVRQTYDPEAEAWVWSDSLRMVGLSGDA